MNKPSRQRLKEIFLQKKSYTLGLLLLTLFAAGVSIVSALTDQRRLEIYIVITVLFALLTVFNVYRERIAITTLKNASAKRKKHTHHADTLDSGK